PPTGSCPSASNCTPRAAIAFANTHAGVDLIKVPAGTVTLNPANLPLEPTTSMFIVGRGPGKTTIAGGNSVELFCTDNSSRPPSVEIDGFTLRNGSGEGGGAVYVS